MTDTMGTGGGDETQGARSADNKHQHFKPKQKGGEGVSCKKNPLSSPRPQLRAGAAQVHVCDNNEAHRPQRMRTALRMLQNQPSKEGRSARSTIINHAPTQVQTKGVNKL